MSKTNKNAIQKVSVNIGNSEKCLAMAYATLWQTDYETIVQNPIGQKIKDNNAVKPVYIEEVTIKGRINNKGKMDGKKDDAKVDPETKVSNIQRLDRALLDQDCDSVIGICEGFILSQKINGDNVPWVNRVYQRLTEYEKNYGFTRLALKYSYNIINLSWLWRNVRVARGGITQIIAEVNGQQKFFRWDWPILSQHINQRNFIIIDKQHEELSQLIADALAGNHLLHLQIEGVVYSCVGAEVYPSQLFVETPSTGKSGEKKKFLAARDGQVIIGDYKVGNALRTIDEDYPGFQDNGNKAIAVEFFGSSQEANHAFRDVKTGAEFPFLFNKFLNDDDPMNNMTREELDFVVACIIRGGVFGEKKEK